MIWFFFSKIILLDGVVIFSFILYWSFLLVIVFMNWLILVEFFLIGIVVIQSLGHVRLFEIPWTAAHQVYLSFKHFLEFAQTHVHWVSDNINHLVPCCPLLILPSVFPSIRVFSKELTLHIRWPKYWSFSFSISPTNEYSELISFRIDWFISLQFKDSQKSSPAPQFENMNSLALSVLYGPTLTSIHDYWKNHSFDYMDLFVSKAMFRFLKCCLDLLQLSFQGASIF